MMTNKEIKKYNKKNDYSYSFGAFPTFELLKKCPDVVEMILVHSTAKNEIYEKAEELCKQNNIPLSINDKLIEKIREKDSCILVGVFRKYSCQIEEGKNHVVLVNPSDYGNLGTIIRTCAGFGIKNIAIIESGIDIFNPKVVRASMGSIFQLNIEYFHTFDAYLAKFGNNRDIYPFMLKGAKTLGSFELDHKKSFSLVFGNEATGLDDSFLEIGQSVLISHSDQIDSLNLSLAVGIAIFEFTKKDFER